MSPTSVTVVVGIVDIFNNKKYGWLPLQELKCLAAAVYDLNSLTVGRLG